jgi:hypothetical protein
VITFPDVIMYLSCLMRRCEKNLKAVGQINFQLVFLSENNPLNFEAPTPNYMTHTITEHRSNAIN